MENKLGVKQLILQKLVLAIAKYVEENGVKDRLDRVVLSLPSKLVLCCNKYQDNIIVYRCAITFSLANLYEVSPLLMAERLVSYLRLNSIEEGENKARKFFVKVIDRGWIDFLIINDSDRDRDYYSIIDWLRDLVIKIEGDKIKNKIASQFYPGIKKDRKKTINIFPLKYVYWRSCSLLRLGEREKLIRLRDRDFNYLTWQIASPKPFNWLDSEGKFCLIERTEYRLLQEISLVIDLFDPGKELTNLDLVKAGFSLSEQFLLFTSNCRFCGEIKQQNKSLSIARLGSIALFNWCMQKILNEL